MEGDGDERSPIGPSEEMQALTMTTEKARHSMIFQYSILFHHAIYSFIHLFIYYRLFIYSFIHSFIVKYFKWHRETNECTHTHICIYIYIHTCMHAFTYIIYSRHTDIHTH